MKCISEFVCVIHLYNIHNIPIRYKTVKGQERVFIRIHIVPIYIYLKWGNYTARLCP